MKQNFKFIEKMNVITVTPLPSVMNQTEFYLTYNQRASYHYDHTALNLKYFQRENMIFLIFNSLIFILSTVSNLYPIQM